MQFHMKKFPKSFWALILFLIAFVLLVLAAVLPHVFTETVFINNSYFGGKTYPISTQTSTGANAIDSNLVNFRNNYKDFIKTFYFGIFFFCVKTEINYYGSKFYGGYSAQGVTSSIGGPTVELGTNCYQYEWSDVQNYYKTNEFDNYMYTESFENSTVIIGEIDASAPGFPGTLPGGGGGGVNPVKPIKQVYEISGSSVFLQYVNVHNFNALRIFVIIALIISFIILVKLVVLAILHCLHHAHDHNKKHRKLFKILHFLFWILKIVWIIILILLLVIYYEIIHFLVQQCYALAIFAIGFAFWFFWVGFIFVVVVFVILHFHHKFLKFCKPHHHHSPPHHEMTHMPGGYPVVTSAAAAASASASASSAAIASNTFV